MAAALHKDTVISIRIKLTFFYKKCYKSDTVGRLKSDEYGFLNCLSLKCLEIFKL